MANARRARAERRAALAARIAQTAPVSGPPHRSPSPAANAATGPAGNEQQASSLHPSVRQDGHNATPSLNPAGSSSHARRAPVDAQAALCMARELLRYRHIDDLYKDWLDRIAELVSAIPLDASPSASRRRRGPWSASTTSAQDRVLAPKRRPHGTTCRVRRPCKKREAAKKSLGHEKTPLRSQRHHGKTARRLQWRCADPIKDKFSTSVESR